MKLKQILLCALLLGLNSCGPEQFATKKKVESSSSNPINHQTNSSCSHFTLIKPQVDFLFLWDNSSSSTFISQKTKSALNNTIDLMSSRFDYHIMLAPLIGSNNQYARFVSETPVGLGSSALSIKVDRSQAANSLNFPQAAGNAESGAQRAADLIKNNISNGIFRNGAYLIVVVMSNQDDNSWVKGTYPIAKDRDEYIQARMKDLLCLRGNHNPSSGACSGPTLNNIQMRFMSIVAHQDKCGGSQSLWSLNKVYRTLSSYIYTASYNNGTASPTDQGSPSPSADGIIPYDSYDICQISDFAHIFDGINNSIQDTLVRHKYNYWPVASSGASAIDPDEIKVFKNGQPINRLSEPVTGNPTGFSFTNSVQNVNTRYEPGPGEPFNGYSIKLYGDAHVTYPECMIVKTQTPKEYFGYVNIQSKPLESSIVLKINGQTIQKSSTNGWQLIKSGGQPAYYQSKNIKIQAPGKMCGADYCQGSPAVNKSGYFLKLNGNAIYSNGATVQVIYDPSA